MIELFESGNRSHRSCTSHKTRVGNIKGNQKEGNREAKQEEIDGRVKGVCASDVLVLIVLERIGILRYLRYFAV